MYNFGPQQFTQAQNNTNLIFVSGIEDVKQRYQMPNTTMEYADSNNPIRYRKTTNNIGESEIKIYELKEKICQNDTKQVNLKNLSEDMITAKFDTIETEIKALQDKLDKIASIKNEIKAINGE